MLLQSLLINFSYFFVLWPKIDTVTIYKRFKLLEILPHYNIGLNTYAIKILIDFQLYTKL